ncbi:MAG: LD-carboxypeptidase [Paludibacteraceae bacterium]|nr:LD-carboxypeptidase [Paludibacteraceae bacterium]
MKYPNKLVPGDEIRIVSPSGSVEGQVLDLAAEYLTSEGFKVTFGEHAYGKFNRFSGTDEERLNDLQKALDDSNVKAIICGRGGYGLTRIIDKVNFEKFKLNPKFVVGFSDITALHAAINIHAQACSIHGPMAKSYAIATGKYKTSDGELPKEEVENHKKGVKMLLDLLKGKRAGYKQTSTNPQNRLSSEKISGVLYGGNLTLITKLRGTNYDVLKKGGILLIEDVGERMYSVDRMMQNLRMSGLLSKTKAIIVGDFSDLDNDSSFGSIEQLILDATKDYNIPVLFGFPAGHESLNLPLIMGGRINIDGNTINNHK